MRGEIVTSFQSSHDPLVQRSVASMIEHWPYDVRAYADQPHDDELATSAIAGWCETRDRLPLARPDAPLIGTDEWTRKLCSYLWRARTFAIKPFVWLDAAIRIERGWLIWLDADTVTTADVPSAFIPDLMREADIAYMGRGEMHPETGVVVFRVPEALPLLRWCVETYRSGAFRALRDGWTDCHVLRAGLADVPVRARDLTSHLVPAWRSSVDACALSVFGSYVTHHKGGAAKREARA